ncbi:MAG: histidine kinase [Bacteroidetes bacterium]|nr:histidine kinase [Bacteroidota bacterium]
MATFAGMRNVLLYSLLAWVAYAAIWVWLFSTFLDPLPAFVRVLGITIPQMVIFYLNLMVLIPRLLDGNSRLVYFLLILGVIIVSTTAGGFLDMCLDQYYPFHTFKAIDRPYYVSFIARFFMSVMPIIVSSLVSRSMQVRKQREESLELKNKMLEAETKALKAQINPHFLFNSLNNIYALSQIKSDKTPDAILHLSDILRYVTYESNQNFVDLKDEIKSIESFILLQALKDDDQSNIRIEISTSNGHYKIPPLLLIPFIENSFKHSNHEDKTKGWIEIKLHAADGKIKLSTANSLGHYTPANAKTGGIGLENVRKRLALIYPDKHKLTIKSDREKYCVELEIWLE